MKLIFTTIFLCLCFSSLAESLPVTKLNHDVLAPFIKNNCVECHGPKKQKGKFRLDTMSFDIANNTEAQLWQDVLDTLNAGDMPPEDENQPTQKEMTLALRELTEGLKKAKSMLTDQGQAITMRRLNRREYANTIKHLFGFTLDLNELPVDDPSEHYDTIGSDQYFSAYLFNKYLEVNRKIVSDALKWNRKPHGKAKIKKEDPEIRRIKQIRENVKKRQQRYEEIVLGLEAGKGWKDLGFDDARAFYYYMKFDAERTGRPARYLKREHLDKGIYLTGQWGVMFVGTSQNIDPRASYKVRVLAGINKNPPERRKFLEWSVDGDFIAQPKVHGTNHKPEWIEIEHRPKYGKRFELRIAERRHNEKIVRFDDYIRKIDRYGDEAAIFIDRIEVEGPFYEETSFFEELMFQGNDQPIKLTDGSAYGIINKFMSEAFRGKVANKEYTEGTYELFKSTRKKGKNVEQALTETLAIVLSSPSFLYLNEKSSSEPGKTSLTNRELAVRLSYLLWSSPPDKQLLALAQNGQLRNPQTLASQVDRMLDNPRSASFTKSFMAQWMDLKRFDQIAIDNKKFPLFDKALRDAVKAEPLEFFNILVKENLPITNLIDSKFLVINSSMAQHYGISGVDTPGFHKVSLAANSQRGGLLTTAAFSTMGSTGERTSPIIRGALILEKILNDPSPSPPPNVPQLNEASKKPVSVRDAVKLHQSKAQCASCHAKLDPIGFGLENFNAIGQWRDKEKVGKKSIPVQTTGTLPGKRKFQNLKGYKQLLMSQKDQLAHSLVEGIMAYGLGRSIEFSDRDTIEHLVKQLRQQNYQARALVHGLVQHKLFQHK
jgi:hypothetical protein